MLIPNQVFAVSKVARKENTHYAMSAVLVERDAGGRCHAVTTDGRLLLRVSWSDEGNRRDYPKADSCTDPVPGYTALIDKKSWDEAGKLSPKNGDCKPILRNVLLDEPDTTIDGVTLSGTDLERRRCLQVTPVHGTFPKYEDVIPKYGDDECVQIGVNPARMADLLNTIAAVATDDEKKGVRLIIPHDPTKAIRLEARSSQGIEATGVLMPVNVA